MKTRARAVAPALSRAAPSGAAGALVLSGCDALSRTRMVSEGAGSGENARARARSTSSRRARRWRRNSAKPISRRTFRSNGTAMPDSRAVSGAGGRRLRRLSPRGRRAGRASRQASRSPSCARCRAARRSRATIASRAGARSASGRARRSRRLLEAVRPKPEARYVMFYCADPMERRRHRASITRASTWTMRSIRRRSSPTT